MFIRILNVVVVLLFPAFSFRLDISIRKMNLLYFRIILFQEADDLSHVMITDFLIFRKIKLIYISTYYEVKGFLVGTL